MYVIATDSRKRPETLFMVDRRKQKKSFWSNRLDDAFIYYDVNEAYRRVAVLKYNNPRVLTIEQARTLEQQNEQIETERLAENIDDESLLITGTKGNI